MSISSEALLIPKNAASKTSNGSPTNVTTVLFVSFPESTSSTLTPSTKLIASTILLILVLSIPSLKLGTHSISFFNNLILLMPHLLNKTSCIIHSQAIKLTV